MIKTQVMRNLDRTMEQVLEQVESSSQGYETSVFYLRFRAAALALQPLTALLHRRLNTAEIYASKIAKLCENF